ncbi:hypothetical protein BZG20_08230 [Salinivibrio sp. IB868]|uniref:hypothetical protein n=1 Tax=unclassified Salinivibrio TaxID=2636825 RepID=UPI0009873D1F|nr:MULTISPECIES: hypothetical protein [unclassified Salinivibrio]OOE66833.1 hypothetical protein BZG20_08230 [Salinivibrio sp. IB868]OOE75705.1 hypothetical protein BZG22_05325 [Salinivibrio sp. IB870]
MEVQNLIPLINTAILLGIFFYQKNKNKVLVDRIEHQEKVLNETKGIVLQQSTAIDSQSKVVDTAIKYSESFSPEKLEKLIRKEVDLEQKEERGKLEEEIERQLREKDERIENLERVSKKSIEMAEEVTTNLLSPILGTLVKTLVFMPNDKKNEILNGIEDGASKEMLVSILTKVESQMHEMISNKSMQPTAKASAD